MTNTEGDMNTECILPELAFDSLETNSMIDFTFNPKKPHIPSGITVNPDFIRKSNNIVNAYISDVEKYAKCNANNYLKDTEKYVKKLVPDLSVINDLELNATDYTNETIDIANAFLKESNFIISLILTLLTCLIIFLALNIITNWLTYGKYQGLIIVIFLIIIFCVTFYIFYYKYYNIILVSFNKLLNNEFTSRHGWDSDMEQNTWVDYAPYVLVIILILAVAILVLNNTYNVLKKDKSKI
jgi:hypothetical protein